MRLMLLGTGCPAVSSRRYGAASLIEAAETCILVDCGSGATQRLVEAGADGARLDALLVTHLHSDHVVDLWQLVVSGWHQGRQAPLLVVAPPGFGRFASGLEAVWAEERAQRLAFERRPNQAGFALCVEEIGVGTRLRIGSIEIEAVAVDHRPVEPAFGYVLRASGQVIVISGDTRACPALVDAARGCDVLVHEVCVHGAMRPVAGRRGPETIDAVASYHTRSSEVGKIARAAQARCLVLTHIVPPDADPGALAAEVARDYAGPVLVGEDLLRLDLATRAASWRGLLRRLPG